MVRSGATSSAPNCESNQGPGDHRGWRHDHRNGGRRSWARAVRLSPRDLVVADIFISYSQQDRDEARLIAAFLEAEGYSVWWDTSLLSGENFRKAIMTELGRARARIVLWTESSVHSDWVQSEAGRAHADRKLIPLKARSISYKDIPPPFDTMHTENAADREKILAAITAQLAKPDAQPSAFEKFTKRARFELLSWFGIVGATISLVANLQAVLTFAKWLRNLL